MATRKGGLGRGLDALIPSTPLEPIKDKSGAVVADRMEVDINSISPNPRQPRKIFHDDELHDLAESIKEVGLLQPPVVRRNGENSYELIMGERRLRASKIAGLRTIPVVIRSTADNELLREAIIENIHRSQLNPLEEAAALKELLEDFNYTHEELAKRVSKSRPAITNLLRLLNLPATVQRRVAAGTISSGHARALLGVVDPNEVEKLANRIVAEGLSVRTVEEIVASTLQNPTKKGGKKGETHTKPNLTDFASILGDHLDTVVKVELGRQKGKIIVEFATLEDLERIKKILLS